MTIEDVKRQAALAARARRAGIPEWQQAMIEGGPSDSVIADIVADSRRSSPLVPSSSLATGPAAPAKPGTGWVDAPAVADWKPPGLDVMDAMMDAQDERDRAELERKLGKPKPKA